MSGDARHRIAPKPGDGTPESALANRKGAKSAPIGKVTLRGFSQPLHEWIRAPVRRIAARSSPDVGDLDGIPRGRSRADQIRISAIGEVQAVRLPVPPVGLCGY